MPVAAVHRNARYDPLGLDEYPTSTEPLDDTSYAWLYMPPNVPIHVTPEVLPPPRPAHVAHCAPNHHLCC